jgi:glycine cleavage system H lipoate-binding protein
MEYTITLTNTEKAAMEYVAYDPQEWIENAFKERARIAIEDIVKLAVDKFLEANQTIPGSRDEIVAAAYANNWIQTVKYKTDNSTVENL